MLAQNSFNVSAGITGPGAIDPNFSSVIYLTHFNNINTTASPDVTGRHASVPVATYNATTAASTAQVGYMGDPFGNSSGAISTAGTYLTNVATGQYVSIASNTTDWAFGTLPFTVEFWWMQRVDCAHGSIMGVQDAWSFDYYGTASSPGHFICFGYNTRPAGNPGNNPGEYWIQIQGANSSVTVGSWNHVAFTSDGTTGRLFVNGTLSGSGSVGSWNIQAAEGNPLTLNCGFHQFDQSNVAQGFDEIRVSTICRYTASFTRPNQPFPNQA